MVAQREAQREAQRKAQRKAQCEACLYKYPLLPTVK